MASSRLVGVLDRAASQLFTRFLTVFRRSQSMRIAEEAKPHRLPGTGHAIDRASSKKESENATIDGGLG